MPTFSRPSPMTDGVLPDPWLTARRQLLLGQFIVGIVAALLALVSQLHHLDPVDGVALPLVVLLLSGLLAALWTRRVSEKFAGRVAYIGIASYFLAALAQQLLAYVPRTGHLSESTYWFAVVYCMAFIGWQRRSAIVVAGATYGVALLVVVALSVTRLQGLDLGGGAFGGFVIQFFSSGLAAILLLYHITALQERYGETRLLAFADFLTGLPNRRCGEQVLEQELRGPGPLTVVLFDLDHFKSVNDTHGHDVGDVVLREAARLTARRVRGSNQLVRWGGEEFLLIMPRTDVHTAENLAERIRADIATHRFEGVGGLTASFGVSSQRPGDTADRLVKRADAALYRAKQQGRNRVKMPTMF
ncbi:GGDEF domain-containing protein [Deinococcus pimensis]|uniref:GGDEF domain-containing protein n=1 Tax=Deinococcus pimensis TaxID=309888 RepID=UPI0004BC3CF5|nr:GGDEF domain-containing protein [Deinococcus pimensis]